MYKPTKKPIRRTSLRLYLGRKYYTFRRYAAWVFSGYRFAKVSSRRLEHEIFTHSTPLIRKLKDVDMFLQRNKVVNLKIAVQKLNGAILHPGETLSYWKLIGKPTGRKGYLKGMVLQSGTFKAGTGGGLCQISNMIYWMAIHTPLTVIERHRHGYDVFPDSNRTQPFGSGATCYYNFGDLMIRNDTSQIYQLTLEVTEHELKGAWRSDLPEEFRYEVYEKQHLMQPEYWGGYTRHNVLFRKKYDAENNLIADDFVIENHAIMMYPPFLDETKNE